jgi:hypothetical protein
MSLLCALALGLLLVGTVAPGTASAHERREVLGGKYQLVVGFLGEPAYQGEPNGLDLTVRDMTQKDASGVGKPVEKLQDTLKAQVIVGGGARTMDLTLAPVFNQPGKYAGRFLPTKEGSYIFRVYGQIEGQAIDERFESGPGRFDEVRTLAQFPEQVTAPATLQARLDAAESRANTAQALGIAGLVVGLLGLGAAALSLLRRPAGARAAAPAGATRLGEGD